MRLELGFERLGRTVQGVGLQLVGPPGSDLRLLELGQVTAALLDVEPQPSAS